MVKMTFTVFCSLALAWSAFSQDNSKLLYKLEGKESAYPRLSKNGSAILYQSNKDGKWQLYVMDLKKGTHTALTRHDSNNNFPDWDADNKWITFVSDRDGNEEIYLMKRDGSGLKRLTDDKARDIHPYFSPDKKHILFNSTRSNGSLDIYRYSLESGKTEQITSTMDEETCARYSPDMKQVVYLKNGTDDDIYVLDLASRQSRNITNTPSVRDGWPAYGSDGKWIYYSSMESGLYCVYRIRPDGSGKQKITQAARGEEDARVNVARTGGYIIYNKRSGKTMEIRQCDIKEASGRK